MRAPIVFFLLLATVPFTGAWFAEHAYRLPAEYPGAWKLLITPKSCAGFENAKIALPKGVEEKEFSKALEAMLAAQTALRQASSPAERQKLFPPLSAGTFFTYAWLSAECFSYASEALRQTASAAQEGLRAVDSVLSDLDNMAGDLNFTGASASAVMAEAAGGIKEIEEKAGGEKGVGPRLVTSSVLITSVWEKLEAGNAESWDALEAMRELGGEDSLLAEEIVFARKAKKAIAELEEQIAGLKEEWARKSLEGRLERGALDAQNLWSVGEASLLFDDWSEIQSSEAGVGSFRQELAGIDNQVKEAEKLESMAGERLSSKKRGWATDGLRLLREAIAALDRSSAAVESLGERSMGLEGKAEARMREAFAGAEAAASAAELSNPVASAKAKELLEKEQQKIRGANYAARGDRINFFLREARALAEIKIVAGSSEAVEEEKARASEAAGILKEMLARADKDGLEIGYERERLKALEYAVSQAPGDAAGGRILSELEGQLAALSDGVLAEALEKYGALLEDYWARARKLSPILTAEERVRLGQFERLFPMGELDVRAALGSLESARVALEKILARAEAEAPTMIRKRLEETMAFEETVGLVRLGESARVSVGFSAKNDLPISYAGEIALSVPLPADFASASQSPGIKVSGGLIRLDGVAEGQEFSLEGSYSEKTAEAKTQAETTLSATESLAVKKIDISFSSKREAAVLIERAFAFPARFSVSSDRPVSWSSAQSAGASSVSAVIEAKPGDNKVTIIYSVDNPVLVRSDATASNGSASFRVSFSNRFADLDGVKLHFAAELPCADKVALAGLDGTSGFANGLLQAEFPVQWFQKGETKNAEVRVQCAGLNAGTPAQTLQTNSSSGGSADEAQRLKDAALALLESGLEPSVAREVLGLAEEATGLADGGDEAGAWKKVSDARTALQKAADRTVNALAERGGKTAQLEALAALGDWQEFFGEAKKLGAELDAAENAAAAENEAKKAMLSDYEKQRADAQAGIDSFSLSFWVPDEGRAGGALKKSLSFKEGGLQQGKAEKALKTLDAIWAASQQAGGLEKHSQAFIGAAMGDLERAKDALAAIVSQAKERAGGEIGNAAARQKEFGTAETQKAVDAAEDALGEGKFFYAEFLASDAAGALLPMTGEAIAGAGAGSGAGGWYWLLGAFGLAALAGLAYVFSARKGKELKEL